MVRSPGSCAPASRGSDRLRLRTDRLASSWRAPRRPIRPLVTITPKAAAPVSAATYLK